MPRRRPVVGLRLIAHIDGGRTGDGELYVGVTMSDLDTGGLVAEHGIGIGQGTNNEAEYSGLLLAIYTAVELGADELQVRSDSKLVVNQMNGSWAIHKNHLKGYADEAHRAKSPLRAFSIKWVPREQNEEADRLSRVARAK